MKKKKNDDNVVQFPLEEESFEVTEQEEQDIPQEDVTEEDQQAKKESEPLPQPLAVLRLKQGATAIVIAVIAVVMAIVLRKIEALLLLVPALYFLWMAWLVEYDWDKGKIEQHVVACTQAQVLVNSTRLVCRDELTVYSYIVPGKKTDFVEGYSYIIWSHVDNPRAVMAYQPI